MHPVGALHHRHLVGLLEDKHRRHESSTGPPGHLQTAPAESRVISAKYEEKLTEEEEEEEEKWEEEEDEEEEDLSRSWL